MALTPCGSVKTGVNSFATLTFCYPKKNCFQLYQNTEVNVGKLIKGDRAPLKAIYMKMPKKGTLLNGTACFARTA